MSAKINDGLTNKQRFIMRHKERLLKVWREEKRRAYAKNPTKAIARSKAWHDAHPEYEKARSKKRWEEIKKKRAENPAFAHQQDAALYARHREYYKQYKEKNREKVNATARRWYGSCPEKSRTAKAADRNRRRARVRQAEGSFTREDVLALLKRQRGLCYWCRRKHGANYHVDHVIPLSRGGSNGRENIVVACPKCNLSKRDKMPHEFAGVLL